MITRLCGFLELTDIDSGEAIFIKAAEITALRAYKGGAMVWFHSPSIHCFIVRENQNEILHAITMSYTNSPAWPLPGSEQGTAIIRKPLGAQSEKKGEPHVNAGDSTS